MPSLGRKYEQVRPVGRGGRPVGGEIVSGMDMIEVVLGTGAWLAGVGLLVVMAALPWLERIGGSR